MKKITRFVNKQITIDGVVGTIYQEEQGSYLFVSRDEGAINSIPVAARNLRYNPEIKQYELRDESRETIWREAQDMHYPFFESWLFSFPNGKYLAFDRALKAAGIPNVSHIDALFNDAPPITVQNPQPDSAQ